MSKQVLPSSFQGEPARDARLSQAKAGEAAELTASCCWLVGGLLLTWFGIFVGGDLFMTSVTALVSVAGEAVDELVVRGVCGGL